MKSPFIGKSIFGQGLVYAPYIPMYMKKTEIKLRYETVDFHPSIKLKHTLNYKSATSSPPTMRRFRIDSFTWLKENAGLEHTDWVTKPENCRIWFKDLKTLTMFKLVFDGFDKI